ncbi:hypothetical protein [Rhizobium sp. P32RR-XVIII]|uniref:hypothetical protein n=1 Tax=Rhizobium sp. P32RR-XVIII TaxID=2726738 RepID=UPI0014571424|nr:hypothetical protein [Rhizobium sp. P32RR-XVIII]
MSALGNRAIYHDGWLAATPPPQPPWLMGQAKMPDVVDGYEWELYNIANDYLESEDLAAKMPRSCTTCSTSSWSRRRNTARSRSTTQFSSALLRRDQAQPPDASSSAMRARCRVSILAMPRTSLASPISSRHTWTLDRAKVGRSADTVSTRSGVNDNDYHVPFKFTGNIAKLTVELKSVN